MAEQDDGRREDRLLVVNHDEVVALVLPHQVRNGLHLQIHIAGRQHTNNSGDEQACQSLQKAAGGQALLLEEGDEQVDHEDVLHKEVDGLQQRSQPHSCCTQLPRHRLSVVGTH